MGNVRELKRKNEEIAEKYHDIEENLSAAVNPVGLFEGWMTGMAEAFGIPFLWISLTETPANAPLIESLRASPLLGDRVNVIDEAAFMALAPKGPEPILANGELRIYYRLLPRNKYFVKSLALAPIILNGRLIGSLNHADSSPTRYEPNMDTSLLQSLASLLSSRLSAMSA